MSVAFPLWLQNSKTEIVESEEWLNVTDDIFDAIQQQLAQNHVAYFTDLTEVEKALFMDRAAKSIQHSENYKKMMAKVSRNLDRHLSNEVARELLEEDPVETKPELILEHVREGAVSLLKKWPDMKGKMHLCLNQRLPENLRHVAWKLFLQNTLARKVFCDTLAEDPGAVRSAHENDIFHKCEALLTAVPVFARAFPEAKASSAVATTMCKVLSYYHAKLRTTNRLIDVQYLMLIPLLKATLDLQRTSTLANATVLANLVEQYITLLESRPSFVRDAWGETTAGVSLTEFCRKVGDQLVKIDSSLTDYISQQYSQEKLAEKDSSQNGVLATGLRLMLKPLIRSMFVGFVECQVVMYMWDQWILGLDCSGYDVWVPLATVVIYLLKEPLLRATSAQQLEEVIQRQSILLKIDTMQYEIHKRFYRELFGKLNSSVDKESLAIDPLSTMGLPAPWVNWTKEVLPERNRAEDRRLVREQRAVFKLRQLRNEQALAENDSRLNLPPQGEGVAMYDKLNHEKQQLEEDRDHLEQLVEQEKRKREDVERRAQKEISQLQAELQKLRRTQQSSPTSVQSGQYVLPGDTVSQNSPSRMSEATLMTGFHPPVNSARISDQPKPALDTIQKFIQKISTDISEVVGGDTSHTSQSMDVSTSLNLRNYRELERNAEREVMGHVMKENDWELYTEADRRKYKQDIQRLIDSAFEQQYIDTYR